MDIVLNYAFGSDKEDKQEVNLRVNTQSVTADMKLCNNRTTKIWVPRAEFKISGNWV